MTIFGASGRFLVSPNAYLPNFFAIAPTSPWPQPQDPRDFYVPIGGSFRPSQWMIDRWDAAGHVTTPGLAFVYWEFNVAIFNTSPVYALFEEASYSQTVPFWQPPPPVGRLYRSPGINGGYAWNLGIPMSDPSSAPVGYLAIDSLCPPHPQFFGANTAFLNLLDQIVRVEIDAGVVFLGLQDCTGPEGGATTSLSTRVSAATVGLHVPFSDTATLTGGVSPTGTITFQLYRTGTTAPVQEATVSVSGNGTYPSPSYMPNVPGVYRYVASYSGDRNNRRVITDINDSNERVEVQAGPSMPGWRHVATRLVLEKRYYQDVGLRLWLTDVHPGVARYKRTDASRTWYKRTKPA